MRTLCNYCLQAEGAQHHDGCPAATAYASQEARAAFLAGRLAGHLISSGKPPRNPVP